MVNCCFKIFFMKQQFFIPLCAGFLILTVPAHADLFHAGGGYSSNYGGFGFDPWITNRLQPKNYYRPELGLYGQAAAKNQRQIQAETGKYHQMAPIPWKNKNIYVD
jgi:hypothetical protein